MTSPRKLLRVAVVGFGGLVFSLLSCGREITAPAGESTQSFGRFGRFAVEPMYESALPAEPRRLALSQVQFEKVRITIKRDDGTIALDTLVDFPVGSDTLACVLTVPLPPDAPAAGLPMSLAMNYVNAAGVVVFTGSAKLTVAPSGALGSPPAAVQVPVAYTGPGAGAASVQISPSNFVGQPGNTAKFSATALDASGAVLAGTPIVFTTSDASVATVDGISGTATLQNKRGTARITAQTLTGQSASASVSVQLPGSVLAASGGGTGPIGSKFSVKGVVTASDGVPVSGVPVTFAVATGGGSVAPATVTTDGTGTASATWTLGLTVGAQSLTVSAAGKSQTVSATAEALKASKIVVTSGPPANGVLGQTFGVTAQVQDSLGAVVKDFAGTLSVGLGTNPPGASLSGTTSATVSSGVATFSGLSVSKAGKGFVLTVSGGGLTAGSSSTFNVAGPVATKLAFTAAPPTSAKAGAAFTITVAAQDENSAVATDFSDAIGVRLTGGSGGLSGPTSVNATGGVATFEGLKIDRPGTYTLTASAGSLTPVTATIVIATGDPTQFGIVSGQSQSTYAGSPLSPITVRLLDAAGNGVPSRSVTFSVKSGGGSVSSGVILGDVAADLIGGSTYTTTTNAKGEATVVWTLGPTVGSQTIGVSTTGVPEFNISANALTPPPGTMAVYGGNNQFTLANTAVLTPPSVLLKDNAGHPKSGVVVTFTPSAGSSLVGTATATSDANGIAMSSGWRLGASGSFTLAASAAGYNTITFTGTVNALQLNVTTAEKLPNGTQQFSVSNGLSGDTYTWSVNDVIGGNSTYGTVSTNGFYTAPAVIPTPATFSVCAKSTMSPTSKGCVSVTITSTPTAGGELIVINDINWGDDTYGFGTSGCGMPCPGNVQFVKNLVNFTPSGVRYGASRVLLINDHGMYSTFDYVGYEGWSVMGGIIRGEGYTTDVQTTHAALSNVPADVKVIMLVMPGVAFSSAEINGLKTFASQGGRIIFFGENGGYYSYGLALEDSFLSNMGAVMTNTGACDAPGVIVNSVPHQLTTGIAASGTGGFYMNCVSHMNLGPNDFALMNYGGLTVAAIAKINYTLLPPTVSLRAGLRESEPAVGEARRPMGVSGWTSTGPVPNKP